MPKKYLTDKISATEVQTELIRIFPGLSQDQFKEFFVDTGILSETTVLNLRWRIRTLVLENEILEKKVLPDYDFEDIKQGLDTNKAINNKPDWSLHDIGVELEETL